MQIKTMDGVLRDVSAVQLEHAYKEAHKDQHKEDATQMQHFLHKVHKYACQYKQKAAQNIKRIAQLQYYPTTEDDVKSAVAAVIRFGSSAEAGDVIYEAVQFQAARFLSHIVSKFVD